MIKPKVQEVIDRPPIAERLGAGSPTPDYVSPCGTVVLYNADCLSVLCGLPAGCVGMVATDPPYGNNYSTGRKRRTIRSTTKIAGDISTGPLLEAAAAALDPLLRDPASIYWFAAPDRLDTVLPLLRRWQVTNVLCWDKGNCTAGDLTGTWGKQWEACVYARTSRQQLRGRRDRDVIRISRGSTQDRDHPTQKPVQLMRLLVAKHSAQVVCDPFMGSGTTGVAAVHEGRQFVGVEVDERYFTAAVERIGAALENARLLEGDSPGPAGVANQEANTK